MVEEAMQGTTAISPRIGGWMMNGVEVEAWSSFNAFHFLIFIFIILLLIKCVQHTDLMPVVFSTTL
jgi:hypothetical protein